VADIDARLGLDLAGGLEPPDRGVGVALGRGVADVDLAAGDVEPAPVKRQGAGETGQGVLGRDIGVEFRRGT